MLNDNYLTVKELLVKNRTFWLYDCGDNYNTVLGFQRKPKHFKSLTPVIEIQAYEEAMKVLHDIVDSYEGRSMGVDESKAYDKAQTLLNYGNWPIDRHGDI